MENQGVAVATLLRVMYSVYTQNNPSAVMQMANFGISHFFGDLVSISWGG